MSFNRFDRMVAIPEDEYKQLRSMQQVTSPEAAHFQQLSKNYNRQDGIRDPYDRVHLQGETLDQMMQFKEQMRERLLQATPKPYQNRAGTLFSFVKDKLQMTPKGEIYKDDGQVIEGSNITDLVQHAVRDRRRAINPYGWSQFVEYLKRNNVPNMILNYDTLDEIRSPKAALPTTKADVKQKRKRKSEVFTIKKGLQEKAKLRKSLRKHKVPKYFEDFKLY